MGLGLGFDCGCLRACAPACLRVVACCAQPLPAGPVWKPPRPRTVLRGLPFMQVLPDELFRAILAAGTVKGAPRMGTPATGRGGVRRALQTSGLCRPPRPNILSERSLSRARVLSLSISLSLSHAHIHPGTPADMRTGVAFWASSDLPEVSQGEAGPGCYVVLSGVIRRIHQRPDGTTKVRPPFLLPHPVPCPRGAAGQHATYLATTACMPVRCKAGPAPHDVYALCRHCAPARRRNITKGSAAWWARCWPSRVRPPVVCNAMSGPLAFGPVPLPAA